MLMPTAGTKLAIWINILLAIVAGIDPAQLVSAAGPWAGVVLAAINAALHAMTGNVPVIDASEPKSRP